MPILCAWNTAVDNGAYLLKDPLAACIEIMQIQGNSINI